MKKRKLKFEISKDYTNPFNNYETSCYLRLKLGRWWHKLDYYGRIRDAKKGAARIAKNFGFSPEEFTIKVV
jgi:hypothetical protein